MTAALATAAMLLTGCQKSTADHPEPSAAAGLGDRPPAASSAAPAVGQGRPAPAAAAVVPTTGNRSLGTNLDAVTYYTTATPFVDAVESGSTWISGTPSTWKDTRTVAVDRDGWVRSLRPGQVARMMLLDKVPAAVSGPAVAPFRRCGRVGTWQAWPGHPVAVARPTDPPAGRSRERGSAPASRGSGP